MCEKMKINEEKTERAALNAGTAAETIWWRKKLGSSQN